MKKIFALALAALMTAGMTTVAFADLGEVKFENDTGSGYVYVDADDDGKFEDGEYARTTVGQFTPGNIGDVKGGKKVAIVVYDENGKTFSDKDLLKGWKIKADWLVGDVDENPDFELVKFSGVHDGYAYAVTFTLPESAEVKLSDLAGSVTIYDKSADLREPTDGVNKVSFGAEYGYEEMKLDEWGDLKDAEVVVFKDAADDGLEGEETLTFGDLFEFEVDVTGQGKLNLKNNTDFNKEFAAMYDYANIDFITFEKEPTFNKNGVVYLYADEDAFVYEVTADGAKEIKGLAWDEDYEAWTFKTRTLKSYAISDVELTEKTVTEDKDDTTTDGGKENPDTGR